MAPYILELGIRWFKRKPLSSVERASGTHQVGGGKSQRCCCHGSEETSPIVLAMRYVAYSLTW